MRDVAGRRRRGATRRGGIRPACEIQEAFACLQRFVAREGHARVPGSHREDGHPLGAWVNAQRDALKRGLIVPERVKPLTALPGWTWDARTQHA
jgi:hypothetical protein